MKIRPPQELFPLAGSKGRRQRMLGRWIKGSGMGATRLLLELCRMTCAAGFSPNVLRILSYGTTGAQCDDANQQECRRAGASWHDQFPRASDSGCRCVRTHPRIEPPRIFTINATTIVTYFERLTAPTLSLRADLQSVCATQSIFPLVARTAGKKRSDRRAGDPHSHRRRVHVHYTTGAGEVDHAS